MTFAEALKRHGECIDEVREVIDRLEREGKDTPEALEIVGEMLDVLARTEKELLRRVQAQKRED